MSRSRQQSVDRIRLLSYNILEGMRPVGAGDAERRRLDRARLAAARSLVQEYAPDILVLNEALFCRSYDGASIDYAALFSYPHHLSALYDREWGNAILSNYPLRSLGEMRIYNRGGLRARVETPKGTVDVASYHPHPSRTPEHKAEDFARLIDELDDSCVVCGDFNAISPDDEIDEAEMVAGFRRFSREPEAALARFRDSGRSVFPVLWARGLTDAIPPAERRHTIPTDLLSRDKSSAMRLDHVFVGPRVHVVDARIIHDPLTHQISDHHPVLTEFEILADAPPSDRRQ